MREELVFIPPEFDSTLQLLGSTATPSDLKATAMYIVGHLLQADLPFIPLTKELKEASQAIQKAREDDTNPYLLLNPRLTTIFFWFMCKWTGKSLPEVYQFIIDDMTRQEKNYIASRN